MSQREGLCFPLSFTITITAVEASSLIIIVAEVKYSRTIALVITTLGALFLDT